MAGTNLRSRLCLIAGGILLAGLASGASVYVTATDADADAVAYEIIDGSTVPIFQDDTQRHLRDVELYGGRAAVLANDFNRWFIGLRHGRMLAYTLGALTIGCALACFWAGSLLSD